MLSLNEDCMNQILLTPPVPLYEHIRETLRQQIAQGAYQHYDRIPSEKELMAQFRVSRITVRQALSDLSREGVIFKVPGKGSYVSKPKPTQELSFLKGFGQAMAKQGYRTSNRVVGLATVQGEEDICRRLGLLPGSMVTEIRRVRYVDEQPISYDITHIRQDLGERLAQEDLAGRDLFSILEKDYGLALGHGEQSIQALIADETLARLLDIAPGGAVLHIERVAYQADGSPLEYDEVFYRGDAFRYRLTINRSTT